MEACILSNFIQFLVLIEAMSWPAINAKQFNFNLVDLIIIDCNLS